MKRIGIAALSTLATCLLAVACAEPTPTVGEWHSGEGFRWRALDVRGTAIGGFTRLSPSRTGVVHRNDVDDERALANRSLLIGAGAAIGDVDGDGLPDLFLASVERPAALYRNLGGMRFEDVTSSSGIVTDSLATVGAVLVDVDGDADLDLLVGTMGGPVKLWSNDGAGRFTDATATSGLVGGFGATTLTLADVEGDGDLDLYVATYKVRSALDAYPPQARAFDQVGTKTASGYAVKPEWTHEYRIQDRPDLGGIVRSQRADPDLFFLNDGTGHFVHTPIRGSRFVDAGGVPLDAEPDFFTLAARFYDVNGDGAPDLYACNDFEDPDQFWLNDGGGRFRLAPPYALAATSNSCMSVDFGDIDRDGSVDIFTADMLSPTLAARQAQIPTHTPISKPIGMSDERPQWMKNMLHRSRGDGSWAQIAQYAGVAATDWTWGSAFLDVDLDGFEDLLTLSGHRWDIRDADTFDRIRNSFPRVPWNREQGEYPQLSARSIALRNNGDLTFRAMPKGWGIGSDEAISHGMALADFDLDGDLDVVVTRLNAPAVIMRNDASAPRVAVRLVGDGANRAGVGAEVTVRAPSLPAQARQMTSGGYYLSGADAQMVFATGADSLLRIEVVWPDGRRSVIEDARPDRLYEVQASGASDAAPAAGRSPLSRSSALFEDATGRLGGHRHHEVLYADFRRQPLLPNRLSQAGPGLAWLDADDDGREDLVIGSGRGGALTVLRNAGSRFDTRTSPGSVAGDLTALIAIPDGRGGTRILAGQSNYESQSSEDALSMASVLAFPLVNGAPRTPTALVAGDTASVGALAVADVNADGWLDLFVGARVGAGSWPVPAPSRLYLGAADGRFVRDSSNAAELSRLGLVSAAVLADLDGDASPELVVATEFGPVRVLHNDGGRFRDITAELALSPIRSRWNGVTVGDFDGDGRPDLVATSWGRNVPWEASSRRPHVLFTGAFGGASLGLVFARADSISDREMPLESFARLGLDFPGLRTRIPTYAEFSRKSVQELFGPSIDSTVRIGATTYDHAIFLNRGSRFEMRPLPSKAQLAPATGVSVADFDGDGREDLFLAQNFFPTEIGSMRFDAGVGLVLLGDGAGGFRALEVGESGVVIRGDQRGAAVADFDGDGRTDLAVAQNGGLTTLWRNLGARPGLRVRLDAGSRNPSGVGSQLRVEGDAGPGPARTLLAGGGYWSQDGSTAIVALPPGAQTLWVRWPSGREERARIEPGSREIRLRDTAGVRR